MLEKWFASIFKYTVTLLKNDPNSTSDVDE